MKKFLAFSLLELLITLTLIIILSSLSFPLYKTIFSHSKEDILASQLLRTIQLARSEAITRDKNIILCHSQNQINCVGQWKNGLALMADKKIFYSLRFVSVEGEIYWRAARGLDYLLFNSSGTLQPENGTFWYCGVGASYPSWAIMVGQMGRPRLVYPNREGEILDSRGRMIKC